MYEPAVQRTVYKIAVTLMKQHLVVTFLLTSAVDILFIWQQQQKIQCCTSMLS